LQRFWGGTRFPARENGNEFLNQHHGLESPCHFGCGCRGGINLDWPMKITETEFFRRMKELPKGKVYGFLSV
jgi:hypothetical protein